MSLVKLRVIIVSAFFALCCGSTALAQSSTATLSGTVEDQNGAVIPNASVSAADTAKGLKRQATTNDQGAFVIPLLPPSAYTVTVEHQGFAPVEISNVVLNVGDNKALVIQMTAGNVTAMVKVNDEPPLINESATVGQVVDRQFVANLPLNGRSFQSLITLSPGVVLTKTNAIGEQGQFSVNGQRPDTNYFTVDGVSANIGISGSLDLAQTGGGSIPGLSALGGTNNLVSVDALQEFSILTSTFAPEFGRTPGAQVSIVTRSGTNSFHGTAFDYFRNDALDANDWFANSLRLSKPPLRQNDFGGVLGGPIVRDRTFFFFSYEGLRLRQPQTTITDVPSTTLRQTASTSMRALLNAFPQPNGPNRLDASGNQTGYAQFAASYSNPSTLNATSIRIDHSRGSNVSLWGRYNYAPSSTTQRGGSQSLNTLATSQVTTQTLTLGTTWLVNATITNDFRFNWSRNEGNFDLSIDDFGGAIVPSDSAFFLAPFNRTNAIFTVLIADGLNAGLNVGKNVANVQSQLNFVDSLSLVRGNHQLKFGVDYRRLTPDYGPRELQQSITFGSIGITAPGVPAPAGSILSGTINSAGITASDPIGLLFTNLSLFGQDAWKINRRLVLTYGLRWDLNPMVRGRDDRTLFTVAGLDDPATMTLAPEGTPLYKTAFSNFAPRVGVSYRLFQTPGRETILRGGFGVFYDIGVGVLANEASTFPYTRLLSLPRGTPFPLDPTVVQPPPFNLNPAGRISISTTDANLKSPYTMQWNVSIDQSLSSAQLLTASYVGAAGRRLLRQELIRNPNARFGSVAITRSIATSDYHALQLKFQRRLSRGLQALSSYTWAKSIDIASTSAPAGIIAARSDLTDARLDRGPSDFDVRHSLSAAISYDLQRPIESGPISAILNDWGIDTIVSARSATPVTIQAGFNALFSSFTVRPDLVPGQPIYVDDCRVAGGRRINSAAFVLPPAGRQGTLGRNSVRGFPAWQIDLALRRSFKLTERLDFQFRTEFFNIFNHPNFGDPGAGVGLGGTNNLLNAQFGQSVIMLGRSLGSGGVNGGLNPLFQIGGPRSIQMSLKFVF